MEKRARAAGKRLLTFDLFGKTWDVRVVPRKHPKLFDPVQAPNGAFGCVYFEDNRIYIASRDGEITLEQQQTALLHEIQHVIEEHFCVNHRIGAATLEEEEAATDKISLGWLYLIRSCPSVLKFVTTGESE